MAKKKSNFEARNALDITSVETVQLVQPPVDIHEEATNTDPVSQDVTTVPKNEPPKEPVTAVQVKKKRIRIRKRGAKKLSAAIICQNPNIVRFI